MAKLQKKPQENHDNDWLNTYADMVTLLLTFFVMLYASSSLDEQKWQYIYQAFQSRGKYLNEYVDQPEHTEDNGNYIKDEEPSSTAGSGELPQSFDQLYVYLSDYVEENELTDSMSVSKDSAHLYIRFDSSVFFGGNSAVLTDAGMDVIDGISPALKACNSFIKQVTVSGHTAAAGISEVNDWDLSSARACSVVKYMEYRAVLSSEQFRTKGVGPHEPVADNSTPEGMAQNRRVEMVILRNDADFSDPQVMQDILKHDYNLPSDVFDPDGDHNKDENKVPDDFAQGIIDSIGELFPGSGGTSAPVIGSGPVIYDEFENFIKAEEPEAEGGDDAASDGEEAAASGADSSASE
ncbi:MAG: flagellar motor protein MotB [Oscillospiraceae bacterium]|nr:flagellar motor protein MotB [Oscillospiraceae bacterium]